MLLNVYLIICRPAHWEPFVHQLQRLVGNSLVLRSLKHITPESLLPLDSKTNGLLSPDWKATPPKLDLSAVMAANAGSRVSCALQSHHDSWSSLWLPIDLILEDAMDSDHVATTSAVEVLTGMPKFQCH